MGEKKLPYYPNMYIYQFTVKWYVWITCEFRNGTLWLCFQDLVFSEQLVSIRDVTSHVALSPMMPMWQMEARIRQTYIHAQWTLPGTWKNAEIRARRRRNWSPRWCKIFTRTNIKKTKIKQCVFTYNSQAKEFHKKFTWL